MMREYPVQEQACLLIDDLATKLIMMKQDQIAGNLPDDVRAVLEQHDPIYAIEHDLLPAEYVKEIDDPNFVVDALEDDVKDLIHMSSFDGSAETFQAEDITDPLNLSYDDDMLVYVPSSKQASLFHQAYKDLDELEQEYRKIMQPWLPDNFPFRKYIVNINGTYYA